ncbi:DUF2267 domain-containing protein [Chryseotalea sanaruensis]|uniref:DUF2267 domain-containing protein n=1 Tax=Chryseotalea sanaruensis TaxID=2482724 RepID=A0A401U631_9BACT|nr:DUF2267 domain-containing protein [Chryseotalea sanaruensis]GCC50388.1 DUF2267 domain-containing protein [Chryseotalea sanaruensis]
MTLDFNKYAMKGNEFLNHLENNLGVSDRAHAGRILRSTLHVLRNHLTFEESLQLISQFPMAIKGVYVDGWTKAGHKKIKTVDDFVQEILMEDANIAWKDFSSKDEIIDCVRAVIATIKLYASAEEVEQALGTLPKKLQEMFESSEL